MVSCGLSPRERRERASRRANPLALHASREGARLLMTNELTGGEDVKIARGPTLKSRLAADKSQDCESRSASVASFPQRRTTTITGSINFTDSAGADLTIPVSGLSGQTSGTLRCGRRRTDHDFAVRLATRALQ